jgi:CRP-like cAMP-binding protein
VPGLGAALFELADGRRQNIAVLLPGDLFFGTLFQERLYSSVGAVTELKIARFASSELQRCALEDAHMLELICKTNAAEQRASEERVVDLGRRSAEERVANPMFGLANRISQHRIREGHNYVFPLLQRHIADLTGLTPVHVCRVMTEFRQAGIMRLSRGHLSIAKLAAPQKIARLA